MLGFIEEVRLENFKSFRRAKIVFPSRLVAITGPNGAGKSNVMDAITFVLGERARSLRAKRLSGLIRKGADRARVTLVVRHGDRRIHVSREIRRNGTSVYRVDGSVKRASEVELLLSSVGLRLGSYCIVSQGDITRIAEMSPRERLQLLEEMSGIIEYENKKQEALRELEEIDKVISEHKAVLEYRERALKEAEEEVRRLRKKKELERERDSLRKQFLLLRKERLMKHLKALEEVELEVEDLTPLERELKQAEMELELLENSEDLSELRESQKRKSKLESLRSKLKVIEARISEKRKSLEILASYHQRKLPPEIVNDPGFLGVVGDLVKPVEGYEVAYRAAGGGRLHDVVVKTYEDALRMISKLKGRKISIRIIPLDVIRPKKHGEPPPDVGMGFLTSFLLYDENYSKLVDLMFGDYVLVRDIGEVPRNLLGKYKFVSLDGEILLRDGTIFIDRRDSDDLTSELNRVREEINGLIKEREEMLSKIEELESEVRKLPDMEGIMAKLKEARNRVYTLRERYRRALEERQRRMARLSELSERKGEIKAELKRLEEELEKLEGVEPASSDDPGRDLEVLEARLRLLGGVDPNAEVKYLEIKKECEELRDLLNKALDKREKALEAINRWEEKKNKEFSEKYRSLREAFNRKLGELLGWSGDLKLVEVDGKLCLMMEVTVPGKKPVDIDAFSGGEKSLIALAFILAAQEVRPSAIYLFDEADSMLDGVNCSKYANMVKKLAEKAQVIIVTLKKETLSEADYVIGITMSDGSSKPIAVRLEDVHS